MNNKYITDTILAQQAGGTMRLSDIDYKEITDRDNHITATIADRQRQLELTIAMQQWYKKNEQAVAQLEDTTSYHNKVNKQYLALRNEEMKLELFDSVQELHPYYEKIEERRRVIEGIKLQESEVAQAIGAIRTKIAEAEKQHTVARDRLTEAEDQLRMRQATIDAGYVVDGEMKMLVSQLMTAEDNLTEAIQRLGESEADYKNRQAEMAQVKQQLESLNLHHQTLAIHQQLFEQYQSVTDKLQLYNSEMKANDRTHKQFADNNSRHSELLVLHEKIKKQLQTKGERLDALVADRKVHEAALADMDSQAIYRHYSLSQKRLIELQSARTEWVSIVAGYEAIESHRAALERMVRQYDQKRLEQQVAERDVKRLFERYDRLRKSFILLQIENTRKLREGLREGEPCPVCGSAHHPYNTEVEQELGERQSQLERDYIDAKREYEARRVFTDEVIAEALKYGGQLEAERAILERMIEQQKLLENDWARFSRLDSSFSVCSSSVNREARRTTIEMLIDSTKRHIEESEQQISRFEFHSTQLHDINIQVRANKAAVDELRQQFWQLDTELQIIHERVETFRALMYESDDRLEHLYKDLDDVVTLSGWRDNNIEEYIKSLFELYTEWTLTNSNLEKRRHEYDMLSYRSSAAEAACTQLRQIVGQSREERDRLRELLNSKREHLRKDFGTSNPAELAASLMQGIVDAQRNCNEAREIYEDFKQQLSSLTGQRDTLIATRSEQEEQLRRHCTMYDHAIARYNLIHPAIHSAELANIFTDKRDWVLLRQTVTECRDALLIAAEQMGAAERQVMELQKAPERPAQNNPADQPEALAQRRTELVLELESLRGEQADIRRILRRHNETSHDLHNK